MKRFLFICTVIITILASSVAITGAQCTPTFTTGNDVIVCSGSDIGVVGDVIIGDGSGNDIIINNGFLFVIAGDALAFEGSGDDVIINNGGVLFLSGDVLLGLGYGDDLIINNGTLANGGGVLVLTGDALLGLGIGDDTIINNGDVLIITGDTALGWGYGEDTIINGGNALVISGDNLLGIGAGDDNIYNSGNVLLITGDTVIGDGYGDDFIINDGSALIISGDTIVDEEILYWILDGFGVLEDLETLVTTEELTEYLFGEYNGAGFGNDIIINNGDAFAIIGDSAFGDGYGDDIIINNGDAFVIIGDSAFGDGFGNDIIINNGTVQDIYGDSPVAEGSGDDLIINNGTVLGDIVAGGGDDYVIIRGAVQGLIDGGSGYDILEFTANICVGAEGAVDFVREFLTIEGLDPADDSVTLGENTYTWVEFEELIANELWIAFCDGRNESQDMATPLVSYCNIFGGLDIFDVNEIGVDGRTTEGVLVIRATREEASAALELAISSGVNQLIAEDTWGNQLWALSDNKLQIMGPEVADPSKTYVLILSSGNTCGIN